MLKQRQIWASVVVYIAQIMNSVALDFDERQLDGLERLIHKARAKSKIEKTEKRDASSAEVDSS